MACKIESLASDDIFLFIFCGGVTEKGQEQQVRKQPGYFLKTPGWQYVPC